MLFMCIFSISQKALAIRDNSMKIDFSQVNDTFIVSNIYISGNFKTKPKIIYNELLFKQFDKISKSDIDELIAVSKQNLEKSSLFNYVYITYWFESPKEVTIEIKVEERWYSWVLPLFELADRNFSAFLENGDWSRMNYGIYFKQENFRGLNETLKLKIRTGYIQEVDLLYQSAVYNNKVGWGANLSYNTMDQICYEISNNEAIYTKSNNIFLAQNFATDAFLHYRHNFYNSHNLYLGFNRYQINDTISVLNPNYLPNGSTDFSYLSLTYKYKFDKRDSKSYPLKGTCIQAELCQSGLGMLQSAVNNLALDVKFNQYGKFYDRFYYGFNFIGLLNSNSHNPYILSNGYGFNDFIDGYEYNVLECDNYAFTKQKFIFELVPTHTKNLNFIPLSQFSKIHYAVYIKTFFNHGFVYKETPDTSNYLSNSYLYSYGLGIDLVTYYDRTISVNYAINKAGVGGFYIHLNIGM